ncbi:MAG: DUF2663 family protein [Sporolactobacillus sp.]
MTLDDLRETETITSIGFVLFKELIERKKEEDKLKKREAYTGYSLLVICSALVVDLFFLQTQQLTSLHELNRLFSDPIVWLLLLLAFVILLFFQHYRKEADDAEDDYDDLREEAIDRSWEIWPRDLSQASRERAMRYLLDIEHINLYYK